MKKTLLKTFLILILFFPVSAQEIKCISSIEKYKSKLNFTEKLGKIKLSQEKGNFILHTKFISYELYNRETLNFLKECMYEIYTKLDCKGEKELRKVTFEEKSKLFSDLFKLKTTAVCKFTVANKK
ncbi:MAG: hypothetical protein GXO22_08770 [Aquificae bacterium]|nr:hypothetical protein [Aquificota bacterium]